MSENLTSVSKQYHVLVCVYNIGQTIYKKGGKSKTSNIETEANVIKQLY